jgi:hypothetical protein
MRAAEKGRLVNILVRAQESAAKAAEEEAGQSAAKLMNSKSMQGMQMGLTTMTAAGKFRRTAQVMCGKNHRSVAISAERA